MDIIVIDDEPLVLNDLVRALHEVDPACNPIPFSLPSKAIDYAQDNKVDVAFLDIEMPGMNGIVCARKLKELNPCTKVVFVTSYDHYALAAFSVHATGYLLKPVVLDDLRRELTFIYDQSSSNSRARLRVQTFGGFEVWANEERLLFKRSKTKELLALLIDRWEDEPYTASRRSYYQTIVSDLRRVLQDAGVADVLVKSWNSLAVDIDLIDCDSYRFAHGDPKAINTYRGDYLPAYSWAEFSVGLLERAAHDNSSKERPRNA